jgi:hypothetical protein
MTGSRTVQSLAVAAMVLGLANATPAQRPRTGAKPAEDTTMKMRSRSEPADTLPDPALVARWASLTAHLLAAFQQDHRSAVGNIEGDFSTLEMKIRLDSGREDAWVTRTFTAAELLSADTNAMAKALYAAAKRRL